MNMNIIEVSTLKIPLIRAIRILTGLGLIDSKNLAEYLDMTEITDQWEYLEDMATACRIAECLKTEKMKLSKKDDGEVILFVNTSDGYIEVQYFELKNRKLVVTYMKDMII